MYLAMSGLGEAVEDLRAATCRFGRELFLPVGPASILLAKLSPIFPNGCNGCNGFGKFAFRACGPAEWDLWVLTIGVRPGPPLDKPLSTWTVENNFQSLFSMFRWQVAVPCL